MKVLEVTTHMNIGGIANYILFLSKGLKRRGAEVLVASSGGNLEPELVRLDIRHVRLHMDTKFEFGFKVFASAARLSRIIRDEKVDIIHAHSRVSQVAAWLASLMTGVPFITTCHGFFKKRMRKVFDTWGVKVIAISSNVKKHLEEDLGVNEERIALIRSGVDVAEFSKESSPEETIAVRKRLGLKDGPVVGTIGRLSDIKGQKFLVEAMAGVISRIHTAQALIVGDGEEESNLRELAKSLGIGDAVHFAKSDPQTGKFLAAMDVFVFPSIKEGLGIALLEALAAGKATVSSRVGGIQDIVEDGVNGILADVGDTQAISDAILALLGDEVLREQMGARGRLLVLEKFNLDTMTNNVMRLYEKVASGRKI